MELKSNIQNNGYELALAQKRQEKIVSPKNKQENLSFCGAKEKLAADIAKMGGVQISSLVAPAFPGLGGRFASFISRTVTKGIEAKYEDADEIFSALNKNFGGTFEECMRNIDEYNKIQQQHGTGIFGALRKKLGLGSGNKSAFSYTKNPKDNTITFHKAPFLKNVLDGIKEFTVGTILDIAVAARKGLRKLTSSAGEKAADAATKRRGFINTILDNRIAEKKARDAFYKVSGVFEQATEGLDKLKSTLVPKNKEEFTVGKLSLIGKNIKKLAQESIMSASKKVGKYNTKTERAWNRLGTGFVSATFAATDFYNISMLQKNNPEEAEKAGRSRFMQDMRRQGLTAGITYVVLGAFQNKVNKSMAYAVLSLGGVTLIAEVLSRLMGKIPLRPLSPEAAKELAEKREKNPNKNKKEETVKAPSIKADELYMGTFKIPSIYGIKENGDVKDDKNVFSIFTDKTNKKDLNTNPTFTSNNQETDSNEKKKSSLVSKIPKIALGIVGFSLLVGFLRSKNVLGIDDIIKSISKKYNDGVKKLTSKRLILPEDQVDGFMNYLKDNGFGEQHGILNKILEGGGKKLKGTSELVQKHLSKSKINPEGLYYDLGNVESKAKSAIAKVVLYPINTVCKIVKGANNIVRKIFTGAAQSDTAEKLKKEHAASFIQDYSKKLKNASENGGMQTFREEVQDAFTRHFSEANSKNKNTTIAMLSRFFITFISGYFFVNDYRNQVLIESKGQDVERANAVMKERIGHKISNFFLNSMFMDLFNTTFEPIYLHSVPGAVGVAMATEFTNETAVRASICTPTKRMNREELIEYENKRLNDKGLKGKYYRGFMKLTGKKPLSEKAQKK